MGKIITGQELITQFTDIVKRSNFYDPNFDKTDLVAFINDRVNFGCEDSNRCVWYRGAPPYAATVDASELAYYLLGSDTCFDIVGTTTGFTYQLKNQSDYAYLKLVDSEALYPLDNIMINNFTWTNGLTVTNSVTGTGPSGNNAIEVKVNLGFRSSANVTLASQTVSYDSVNNGKLKTSQNDVIFVGGHGYATKETDKVVLNIEINFKSTSSEVKRIEDSSLTITTSNGSFTLNNNGQTNTAGNTKLTFSSSNMSILDVKNMTGIDILGDWVTNDVYSTIYLTNMYIQTSSTSNLYISGATRESNLVSSTAYLLRSHNLEETDWYVDFANSDLSMDELVLRLPGQYKGNVGRFLIHLSLYYRGGYYYELYIPIYLNSNGTITTSYSYCYLDIARVSNGSTGGKPIKNNRGYGVTIRPLTSGGTPSLYIEANNTSGIYDSILSTVHIYPDASSTLVQVQYNNSTNSTSLSTATIKSNVANTTVNLIPYQMASGGLVQFLQKIGRSQTHFSVNLS
jgi:hypothetical protein